MTKRTRASVAAFLKSIKDPQQRADSVALAALMRTAVGAKPEMWGANIVGFGSFHYASKSCEGDWMLTGFSPRKQNMTIYVISGFAPFAELMPKLGRHKTSGGGCLYFHCLADLHLPTLRKLIKESAKLTRKRHVAKA